MEATIMDEFAAVIKNLIHIDKNAVEIRNKVKNEIESRKSQMEEEIKKLKIEIVDEELKKIEEYEKVELDKVKVQVNEFINEANLQSGDLERKYQDSKEKLVLSVLDELFKI